MELSIKMSQNDEEIKKQLEAFTANSWITGSALPRVLIKDFIDRLETSEKNKHEIIEDFEKCFPDKEGAIDVGKDFISLFKCDKDYTRDMWLDALLNNNIPVFKEQFSKESEKDSEYPSKVVDKKVGILLTMGLASYRFMIQTHKDLIERIDKVKKLPRAPYVDKQIIHFFLNPEWAHVGVQATTN